MSSCIIKYAFPGPYALSRIFPFFPHIQHLCIMRPVEVGNLHPPQLLNHLLRRKSPYKAAAIYSFSPIRRLAAKLIFKIQFLFPAPRLIPFLIFSFFLVKGSHMARGAEYPVVKKPHAVRTVQSSRFLPFMQSPPIYRPPHRQESLRILFPSQNFCQLRHPYIIQKTGAMHLPPVSKQHSLEYKN